MRTRGLLFAVVLAAMFAATLPTWAGVTEKSFGFFVTLREGKVDVELNLAFSALSNGGVRELGIDGFTVRPQEPETVRAVVNCPSGWMKGKPVKFFWAIGSRPKPSEYREFNLDELGGWYADMGPFPDRGNGLGYILHIRVAVHDGVRKDLRFFGIKVPVVNQVADALGMTRKNLQETLALSILPTSAQQSADGQLSEQQKEMRVADPDKINANLQALLANDQSLAANIEELAGRLVYAEQTLAELEARVESHDQWVREFKQANATPQACNWRLDLPPGVVVRVETLDSRGQKAYSGRWTGNIPFNDYRSGPMQVWITWEGASAPGPRITVDVHDGLVVGYTQAIQEVR